MSDESKKTTAADIIAKAIDTPGDVAAFLVGTAGGVILDIFSAGVSLGQGTLLGGSATLGAKKGYDAWRQKSWMRQECVELITHYETQRDEARVAKLRELIQKIDIVKSLPASKIRKSIDEITK